jgi:hypothetical protein
MLAERKERILDFAYTRVKRVKVYASKMRERGIDGKLFEYR